MKKFCLLVVALSGLGLTACETAPPVIRPTLVTSPQLQAQRPLDIAVLPVEDATEGGRLAAVAAPMREQLNRSLVRRRYAPLARQAVDAACIGHLPAGDHSIVSEATLSKLAGRCSEDAMLAVRVNRWDDSSLLSRGVVRFSAEVNLFSARSKAPLWSGNFQGTVKAGGLDPAPIDPTERARSAAEEFARQLLLQLPSRML